MTRSDPTSDSSLAPQWPLAGLRIYLGLVFALAGIGQLNGVDPWGPRSQWPTSLMRYVAATGSQIAPFYAGVYRLVLMPHKDFVGTLMPIVHVAIGLPLLLGLATRPAAGVGLFCLMNYMALTGVMPYHPDAMSALAALMLTVLLTSPNEVWSLRTVMRSRQHEKAGA